MRSVEEEIRRSDEMEEGRRGEEAAEEIHDNDKEEQEEEEEEEERFRLMHSMVEAAGSSKGSQYAVWRL